MDPFRYENRWALVTGASSGIGAAFAWALATRGMHLLLAARRAERLEALAAELSAAHGIEAIPLPCDLAEPAAPRLLWERASAGREIHLLVNDAGFGLQGRFDESPLERQLEMVRVNDLALTELCGRALPPMRARGAGGVINLGSVVGFLPVPGFAVYAASKAYVLTLSEALWEESRHDGVRVLALCPGGVGTEFQAVAGSDLPAGGLGVLSPDQVAEAALHGLDRGVPVVVPGLANRAAAAAPRLLPRSWITRTSGWFRRRVSGGH
ncbi:SDR family NAD(P)-dependent oxidoreductase [Vulgatibacter sp.]|uniref:SDR family NAD(P)-dependent oxidoreductase n=1 Tax=Vulgatibacter sp. TaxID=1971226 RepID=UPI0035670F36